MDHEPRKETLVEKIFLLVVFVIYIFIAAVLLVVLHAVFFGVLLLKALYELFVFAMVSLVEYESKKETNEE